MLNSCQDVPQVDVDFMNGIHCEELELVKKLHKLLQEEMKTGNANPEVDKMLEEWLLHTIAHFDRENELMRDYNFPPYPIHFGEHQEAIASLRTRYDEWQNSRDTQALNSFIEEWYPWFINHINTMDTVTAQFLSRFGIR